MLGRRDLRRLYPLPERGPVGAPADLPPTHAEQPSPDAAARSEPAGLPPLRGHGRRQVRREVRRERHGRLPGVRRAQRPAQPRAGHGGGQEGRQARPGHHLLHRLPVARHRGVREAGGSPARHGCAVDRPQGHGRPAQAAARLRHREGHQGDLRRRPDQRALPRHHGCHARVAHEGHRGRGGRRRHRHLLDLHGSGPQPDRVPGRNAQGNGLHDRSRHDAPRRRSGTTSTWSGRSTPASCHRSRPSTPTFSSPRSPAG